jgi:hypothetical protein
LKNLPLSWFQRATSPEGFFQRERDAQSIFLTPSGNSGEVKPPVQMRFGTELNWEGQPSTVLLFYFQEDIPLQDSHTVHLNG